MSVSMATRRDGFTIVEVLLALLLLSFTVMGFQAATGKIIHYSAQSDRQAVAVHVAQDRVDMIRLDPEYEMLSRRYAEPTTELVEYPGLERTTRVVRTNRPTETGSLDYTRITVTVDGAGLRRPVSRTIVVGHP